MATKNTGAFYDMTQEAFIKFMDEGTALSAALEKSAPPLSAMIDEMLEIALRIRTLRQYCLNSSVAHGGTMMVDAERVIAILDGG